MSGAARVLLVDDEPHVLAAFERSLGRRFVIHTAEDAHAALDAIEHDGPFAVVVSDMRMPGQDGAALLAELERRAPHTLRVMLTGNIDQATALRAINEGQVFRLLQKPCPAERLAATLEAAIERWKSAASERALLEQTVGGVVKLLVNLLGAAMPEVFGELVTLRRRARAVAETMNLANLWEIDAAALLSRVGWLTLPESARIAVARDPKVLSAAVRVGGELLRNIPRLERVAEAVAMQEKGLDGSGPPEGEAAAPPQAARILKALNALAAEERQGLIGRAALSRLIATPAVFDPQVLVALAQVLVAEGQEGAAAAERRLVLPVGLLRAGDVLAAPVTESGGKLLMAAGLELSEVALRRLLALREAGMIAPQLQVTRIEPVLGRTGS